MYSKSLTVFGIVTDNTKRFASNELLEVLVDNVQEVPSICSIFEECVDDGGVDSFELRLSVIMKFAGSVPSGECRKWNTM